MKLGTYQLAHEWVDVYLKPGSSSGQVLWDSSKGTNTEITIGIGCALWECYGLLLHEAMEVTLDNLRCRFKRSSSFDFATSDCYVFHADHLMYTEACSRVGAFIHEVKRDLDKAYKKHHNK